MLKILLSLDKVFSIIDLSIKMKDIKMLHAIKIFIYHIKYFQLGWTKKTRQKCLNVI